MAITKTAVNAKTIVGTDEPLLPDINRGDVVLSTNKGVLTKNQAGDALEVIADLSKEVVTETIVVDTDKQNVFNLPTDWTTIGSYFEIYDESQKLDLQELHIVLSGTTFSLMDGSDNYIGLRAGYTIKVWSSLSSTSTNAVISSHFQGGSMSLSGSDVDDSVVEDMDMVYILPSVGASLIISTEHRFRRYFNMSQVDPLVLKKSDGSEFISIPPRTSTDAGVDPNGNYLHFTLHASVDSINTLEQSVTQLQVNESSVVPVASVNALEFRNTNWFVSTHSNTNVDVGVLTMDDTSDIQTLTYELEDVETKAVVQVSWTDAELIYSTNPFYANGLGDASVEKTVSGIYTVVVKRSPTELHVLGLDTTNSIFSRVRKVAVNGILITDYIRIDDYIQEAIAQANGG